MEIASFNYKDKEYVILIKNNKIIYGYKNNQELITDLTKEEDEMLRYVISKVFISKDRNNHYKCGVTFHNQKKFQIMYDEISCKKFFYEIEDNKYKIPSLEDIISLYERFNIISFYNKDKNKFTLNNEDFEPEKYLEKTNKKIKKKFKQVLAWGTIIIVVSINIGNISNIVYPNNFNIYSLVRNKVYDSFMDKDFITKENLGKCLDKNTRLSEEEKNHFRKFFEMAEDNKEFIQPYTLKDRLESIGIVYDPKQPDLVSGEYKPADKTIYLYNMNSYEDILNDKSDNFMTNEAVIDHEVCHIFGCIYFPVAGWSLMEAVNEQLKAEYLNTDTISYNEQLTCMYSLCEIINPDSFKMLNFSGSNDLIIEELEAIIKNKDKAYDLLGNIDVMSDLIRQILVEQDEKEKELLNSQLKEVKSEIYDRISEYFYAKYNYPIEEDRIMMAYLVNSGFNEKINNKYEKFFINPKDYFRKTNRRETVEIQYLIKNDELSENGVWMVDSINNLNRRELDYSEKKSR